MNKETFLWFILVLALTCLLVSYLYDRYLKHKNKQQQSKKYVSVDEQYLSNVASENKEVNRILDKISAKGLSSLTKRELQFMNNISKKYIDKNL